MGTGNKRVCVTQTQKYNSCCFTAFPKAIYALDCTHISTKYPSGAQKGDFVHGKFSKKYSNNDVIRVICDCCLHNYYHYLFVWFLFFLSDLMSI